MVSCERCAQLHAHRFMAMQDHVNRLQLCSSHIWSDPSCIRCRRHSKAMPLPSQGVCDRQGNRKGKACKVRHAQSNICKEQSGSLIDASCCNPALTMTVQMKNCEPFVLGPVGKQRARR